MRIVNAVVSWLVSLVLRIVTRPWARRRPEEAAPKPPPHVSEPGRGDCDCPREENRCGAFVHWYPDGAVKLNCPVCRTYVEADVTGNWSCPTCEGTFGQIVIPRRR
ncbi:hypothetical protein [Streptomyces apocyni]|uniref:hypothetical protein n=1 Tax=Streptomyces apocyni TaxID=2654677 RepID=UPI0012EAA536|nr:hypothetical protein [Streptomyces apocyni]